MKHKNRRRKDIAPAVLAALKFVGPMLASELTRVVASSIKEQVTDPALESARYAAMSKLEQVARDNGRDEARSAQLMRNARKETEKLQGVLRREGRPISNKLNGIIQGLKYEEMRMLRGDSKPVHDSRARRSQPGGRPTNWELKVVIGIPQNGAFNRNNYTWIVNRDGSISVSEKFGRGHWHKTRREIDDIEMFGEGGGGGGGGFGQWVGTEQSAVRQGQIEARNREQMKQAAGKIGSVVGTAAAAVDMIAKISQGLAQTVNRSRQTSELMSSAINQFKEARRQLTGA